MFEKAINFRTNLGPKHVYLKEQLLTSRMIGSITTSVTFQPNPGWRVTTKIDLNSLVNKVYVLKNHIKLSDLDVSFSIYKNRMKINFWPFKKMIWKFI